MSDKPIIEILIAIQSKIDVPKSRENTFGGYMYRSAEDIWNAAKPLFAQYGLFVMCTDRVEERAGHPYQVATIQVMGADKSTGTGFSTLVEAGGWAREDDERKKMDSPQLSGSAASYAAKRAWGNLLGLDDVKDSDATNISEEPKTVSERAKEIAHPVKFQFSDDIMDYANKNKHPELIAEFRKLFDRKEKVVILNKLQDNIDEIISMPDFITATLKALDDCFKLLLTATHDQEHNRILKECTDKGMSTEQAINIIEGLGLKPQVRNNINLDGKKEGKQPSSDKYVKPDTSYI